MLSGLALVMDSPVLAHFGNYWVVLAGAMLGLAHLAALFAGATHLYGCRQGYRQAPSRESRLAKWISLDTMLVSGGLAVTAGLSILVLVLIHWSRNHFGAIPSVLPAVVGTTLIVVGAQNAFGGFLLAIINGHEAEFLKVDNASPAVAKPASVDDEEPPRALAS